MSLSAFFQTAVSLLFLLSPVMALSQDASANEKSINSAQGALQNQKVQNQTSTSKKNPQKQSANSGENPSETAKPADASLTDTLPPQAGEDIDWGGWDSFSLDASTADQSGVGIRGKIETELSQLDKSNLLENATGVATQEKASNTLQNNKFKQKDLKKAMAELEAMEAKVKKEIEDDTEF